MKRTHIIVHEVDSSAVRARRTREDWCTFLEIEDDATWDDIEESLVLEFMAEEDFSEFVEGKVMGFAAMPKAVRISLGLEQPTTPKHETTRQMINRLLADSRITDAQREDLAVALRYSRRGRNADARRIVNDVQDTL